MNEGVSYETWTIHKDLSDTAWTTEASSVPLLTTLQVRFCRHLFFVLGKVICLEVILGMVWPLRSWFQQCWVLGPGTEVNMFQHTNLVLGGQRSWALLERVDATDSEAPKDAKTSQDHARRSQRLRTRARHGTSWEPILVVWLLWSRL